MNFGMLYKSIMEDEEFIDDEEYELEEGEEVFDVLELDEDECEKMEFIGEGLKRTVVIRNGVRKVEVTSDREGYKVVRKGNVSKEVKLSGKESRTRTKAQFKGDKKRQATRTVAQKKRQVSIKKRGV